MINWNERARVLYQCIASNEVWPLEMQDDSGVSQVMIARIESGEKLCPENILNRLRKDGVNFAKYTGHPSTHDRL